MIDSDARVELMGEEILLLMVKHSLRTPVIIITAIADSRLRDRFAKTYSFVSEVLQKPVSIDELRDSIRKITIAGESGEDER